MNLVLIQDERDKAVAQQALKKRLAREMPSIGKRQIGYPGGNQTLPLHVRNDFWFASKDSDKQWNAFGFLREKGGQQFITVEINIPIGSNTRRIAGFFGKDTDTGRIYILHSGDIGGGAKGVGKNAFLTWTTYKLVSVVESDGQQRPGILVASVDSPDTVQRLEAFAERVRDFKDAAKKGLLNKRSFRKRLKRVASYTKEFVGRKRGTRSAAFDYETYHGEIVEALKQRAENKGFRTQNKPEDLLLWRGQRIAKIYEVKTSTDLTSIYKAIGQLLVYSNRHGKVSRQAELVMVVPAGMPLIPEISACLDSLGIQVESFTLENGVVRLD